MKVIKFLLSFIAVVAIVIVLVLGYFGFVPGVSALFGSNQPRDLGVRHTQEDLNSVQGKLDQSFVEPEADTDAYEQLKESGSAPVDAVISQEEFSSHIEKVNPVSDVQVKIDGSSFEMSGRIVRPRIPDFARTLGITGASDAEILDAVDKYLPSDPVFYLKGSGSTTNNDVALNLESAEIGRLPVPLDMASQTLEDYIELLLDQAPGFSGESITLENGQLHFKGTSTKQIPSY